MEWKDPWDGKEAVTLPVFPRLWDVRYQMRLMSDVLVFLDP